MLWIEESLAERPVYIAVSGGGADGASCLIHFLWSLTMVSFHISTRYAARAAIFVWAAFDGGSCCFFAIECEASASRAYLLVSRRMPENVSAAVGMTIQPRKSIAICHP
jgi:hypothetical protein